MEMDREVAISYTNPLGVAEAFPGRRYLRYRTTPAGERLIQQLASEVSPEERAFVQAIRRYVSSRSFARLLREVYKAYPAFAVNSRFAG